MFQKSFFETFEIKDFLCPQAMEYVRKFWAHLGTDAEMAPLMETILSGEVGAALKLIWFIFTFYLFY